MPSLVNFFIPMIIINLSLSQQENPNKLISAIIYKHTHSFQLRFHIGSPSNQWSRSINQESDISCITNSYYSPSESTNPIRIGHVNGGIIYSDVFSIDNNNITYYNFQYIYTENRTCLMEKETGWFGFGYIFKDTGYSIVHLLYNQKQIDHLSYSFTFNASVLQGSLYFGGIPENNTRGKKSGKCKVRPFQSKWSCPLSNVMINDILYVNTYESSFQAMSDFIYVPKFFMTEFINNGLKGFIENKTCTIHHRDSLRYIYCDTVQINFFPVIKFVFGDFSLTLTGTDYSNTFGKSAEFYIRENPKSNGWILGCTFLKTFDSWYNYEDDSVTFFSVNKLEVINDIYNKQSHLPVKDNITLVSIIHLSSSLLMIIGIVILMYWKFNKN